MDGSGGGESRLRLTPIGHGARKLRTLNIVHQSSFVAEGAPTEAICESRGSKRIVI
jgi:hypothetical protein